MSVKSSCGSPSPFAVGAGGQRVNCDDRAGKSNHLRIDSPVLLVDGVIAMNDNNNVSDLKNNDAPPPPGGVSELEISGSGSGDDGNVISRNDKFSSAIAVCEIAEETSPIASSSPQRSLHIDNRTVSPHQRIDKLSVISSSSPIGIGPNISSSSSPSFCSSPSSEQLNNAVEWGKNSNTVLPTYTGNKVNVQVLIPPTSPTVDNGHCTTPSFSQRGTPSFTSGGGGSNARIMTTPMSTKSVDARRGLLPVTPQSRAAMQTPSGSVVPLGKHPISPDHDVIQSLNALANGGTELPTGGAGQEFAIAPSGHKLELKSWKQGELLGKGSSGEVYKSMVSGQFFAVKKIPLMISGSSQEAVKKEAENLRMEIEMLRHLNHVRIVRYIGCLLDYQDLPANAAGQLLIFLEYMPSGSISHVLKRFGAYGPPLVKKYTRQLLEGLAYLHSKNIVHRDVKGGNILVDQFGDAKISDFGACKHLEALHTSMTGSIKDIKGSVYWMAPESVYGNAGRRSDIWSAGCTMIEMATGNHPWHAHPECSKWSLAEVLDHIVCHNEIPPVPSCLTADAKRILLLMLTREHNKRPYAHVLLKHPYLEKAKESSILMGNPNHPS